MSEFIDEGKFIYNFSPLSCMLSVYICDMKYSSQLHYTNGNCVKTDMHDKFIAEVPVEDVDVSTLSDEHLRIIEADSFWCFSKLLDGIQDNYTFAQPGIQLKVNALKELISRIDSMYFRNGNVISTWLW